MITITNTKNRRINLGSIKGRMLSFNPDETKTLSDELSELFSDRIAQYVEGGFLCVETVKKPRVTNEMKEGETVVTKKTTKKATKKGSVATE